ncbi:MAG: metalloregulator ArsR/SmtB family transcription factor [Actinomycetota bacterium]
MSVDTSSPAVACCSPLAAEPLSEQDAETLAGQLKALADPARLRVLSLLMASAGGEACTCDLVEPLGLAQSTVTHHLRRLADAGLVTGDKRGRWTYYSVDRAALEALRTVLDVSPPPR